MMDRTDMKSKVRWFWNCVKRKKTVPKDDSETPLKRCLTTFDLTLLGIGNMTGSGIYVLTGSVMTEKAGPATFLSYLFAGIAAFLNALCYAELCSKMPKSGSAYLYTYVAGGEFLAFVIGWSIVLEYVLSVASVAKGWSGTIDTLSMNAVANGTMSVFGRFPNLYGLGEYPDMLAVGIIVILALLISFGPKLSVMFNSSITIINIIVILLATGIMLSNPNKPFIFAPTDKGGFMPMGFTGIVAGAGTCFYAFIGFDAVTISSEEAISPSKSIPIANGLSVSFVTILFVISSAALPIFVPWYKVDSRAAFTSAFKYRQIDWAAYVTGIGSLFGISASLFTSIYALPRFVYSMASDGLLMKPLDYVYPRTQVPVVALWVFTILAAILALIFDIHILADFLSIGTLIAYTLVCLSLLILRYNKQEDQTGADGETKSFTEEGIGTMKTPYVNFPILRRLNASWVPNASILTFAIVGSCFCSLLFNGFEYLKNGDWWIWMMVVVLFLGMVFCIVLLKSFEQNEEFTTFKVPFVPIIPLLTVLMNVTLIINLSAMTWIRFVVWLIIGLFIYFIYGIHHSKTGLDTGTNEFIKMIPPNYESIETEQ